MAGGIIGWRFFDAEAGLIPEGSGLSTLPGGGKGRIVVLASTPFTTSKGWAARAAVTLAKEWSEEGLRIFLMDLGLNDPSVHGALGLPNGEGVSDAFLFGASVQHIAKPVLDDSFFFAPAGSPPGDPEEVLGHPRWNDLTEGFSEAEATLVLFLPTEIAGADKILTRATDIFFFSAQGESADAHLGPASTKVVSVMGPFGSAPAEVPEVMEEPPEDGELPGLGEEFEEPEAPAEQIVADAFGPEFEPEPSWGGDEETPSLEISGGLELDAGFGAEEVPAETPDWMDEGPESDGSGFSPDLAEIPDSGQTTGGDIVMGSDVLDTPEVDSPVMDTPGEGIIGGELDVPDFGPDFVDMSPALETGADDGQFGGELVQGPDLGVRATGEDLARSTEPPARAPVKLPPKRAKPVPKRRPTPKKKFSLGKAMLILILLGAVGAVAGSQLGYLDLNLPEIPFLQVSFGDPPEPPLVLPGPMATEEVLRFSLVLFSYDQGEVADAMDMLEALRSRLPRLLFALVLGDEQGETSYSLLAGPARDRIEAEDLRVPLAEILTREDPSSWSVRETPRAFYLGEYGTLSEAREYVSVLSLEGIHAYILQVTYADGGEGYRVLSGAFEGIEDARTLQRSLQRGGYEDVPLIERRGRLPE